MITNGEITWSRYNAIIDMIQRWYKTTPRRRSGDIMFDWINGIKLFRNNDTTAVGEQCFKPLKKNRLSITVNKLRQLTIPHDVARRSRNQHDEMAVVMDNWTWPIRRPLVYTLRQSFNSLRSITRENSVPVATFLLILHTGVTLPYRVWSTTSRRSSTVFVFVLL